ncbi:MAG: cupin domain-containing protein [Candidatus Eisenbacteria bacterium]
MEAHEIADIELRRRAHGKLYEEFVRHPSMSLGLYVLPVGGLDPQQPHTEDEAYLVLRGRGRITVELESRDVGPGSVVFVPARAPHKFHDITEELSVVVLFAPAEYSQRPS